MVRINIKAICMLVVIGFVCFVSIVEAATEVYSVKPTSADSSGSGNNIKQYFVATCDSIDSLLFFVGAEETTVTKKYVVYIYDSLTDNQIWTGQVYATGLKYQDVGFGVHKAVTRGRVYYVKIYYSDGDWNYYYQGNNPYPWGNSSAGNTKDIAALIIGTNHIENEFWGVNAGMCGWPYYSRNLQRIMMSRAKEFGIKINREQPTWCWLEQEPGVFSWDLFLDSAVIAARDSGLTTVINFYGTPKWASILPPPIDSLDSLFYLDTLFYNNYYWRYPPKNLYASYDSDSNYLYNFVYALARRYSLLDVHDYEVYNELNFYNTWRFGLTIDTTYNGITLTDTFFYGLAYGPLGHETRARLYVKACSVAHDACLKADKEKKIHTNAICCIRTTQVGGNLDTTGAQWLEYFYENGGGPVSDVITYHWYMGPYQNNQGYYKFLPSGFHADYDTIRSIMSSHGDRNKPVWCNEGGFSARSKPGGYCVTDNKQADIVVQAFLTSMNMLLQGYGPDFEHMNWFSLLDSPDADTNYWDNYCGLTKDTTLVRKPSGFAYKQMTTKLNDLVFNRRLYYSDTLISCFEFQETGENPISRKTWVFWKEQNDTTSQIILPVRTWKGRYEPISYDEICEYYEDDSWPHGLCVSLDTYPAYVYETGPDTLSQLFRPDLVVDSFYITPANPKIGDDVWLRARIKNIGTDSVWFYSGNSVTFQVDGSSVSTYTIWKCLNPGDTLTLGNFTSTGDWEATHGKHLFQALADSVEKIIELNEYNNIGYCFTEINGGLKKKGDIYQDNLNGIPRIFFINDIYPNPVSGKEVIMKYGLPRASPISIIVYNVAGQTVWEYNQLLQTPGYYTLQWNLRDRLESPVSSGVYFYLMKAGSWMQTKKMIVIQ